MKIWQYVVVFIIATALYSNTIGHDYALDDKAIITSNKFTQQGIAGIFDHFTHSYWYGINGKDAGNYRPLSGASFSIENELFGNNPQIGHFLNVLFFGLLCIVLLHWLVSLNVMSKELVFITIILFASHPIHTEVVANIKSRDEIYCFLFFALSGVFFWKWLNSQRWLDLALFSALFLASLLSKETAIALLPIFPILAFRKNTNIMATLRASIAPVIVSIFYLMLYLSVTDILMNQEYHLFDNALVQTAPASMILATKFWILGDYVRLLFIPYPLLYDYSYNTIELVDFSSIGTIATLVGIAVLIYWRFRQFRSRNESSQQDMTLALAIFILPIIPISNLLFPIGSTMAERFLFIPSLGFLLIFVHFVSKLLQQIKIDSKLLTRGTFLLIVIPLALVTLDRNKAWASDEVLFATDIEHLPRSAKAHHNLANIYKAKAEASTNKTKKITYYESAIQLLEKAVSIYEVQEFHRELGLIYGELGKWEGVKKSLGNYLKFNPKDATAWMQIGIAYGVTQDMDNALTSFEMAYELNPKEAEICLNLAKTYAMLNRVTEARRLCEKCLEDNPNNTEVKQLNDQLAQSL